MSMANRIPFSGKKRRIAVRLLNHEPPESVATKEHTTLQYVRNVQTELNKLVPAASEQNPQQGSTTEISEWAALQPHARIEPADPSLKQLEVHLNEIEGRNTTKQQRLTLMKRVSEQTAKEKMLDREIRLEERKKWVTGMPYDFADYDAGMRVVLKEDPVLEQRLRQLFEKNGLGSDFEANLSRALKGRFENANHTATNLPRFAREQGIVMDKWVSTDYPETEWDAIIEGLEGGGSTEVFARHRQRLDWFRACPNFNCPQCGGQLTHSGGPSFVCPRGHRVTFPCPDCGFPLFFDGNGFHCAPCFRRAVGPVLSKILL